MRVEGRSNFAILYTNLGKLEEQKALCPVKNIVGGFNVLLHLAWAPRCAIHARNSQHFSKFLLFIFHIIYFHGILLEAFILLTYVTQIVMLAVCTNILFIILVENNDNKF